VITHLGFKVVEILGVGRSALRRERGQDLIEYALLSGLIAAGIVAVVALFTGSLESMVAGIGRCIDWDGTTECLG
jgi:Flp pilus assembly pilin Flp